MDMSTKLFVVSAIVSIVGAMFAGGYLFSKAGYPFGRIVANSLWMAGFSFVAIFLLMIVWLVAGLPKDILPAIFPLAVFGFFYWLKHNYSEREATIESDSSSQYEERHQTKIFQCPECARKLRVSIPAPKSIGRCPSCNARYKLSEDTNGFLYIYLVNDAGNEVKEPVLNIGRCYEILGVPAEAAPSDIKSAYKRKIKEYHPDKVSTLGVELRDLAEKKSKEIIGAYKMLKQHGLAE